MTTLRSPRATHRIRTTASRVARCIATLGAALVVATAIDAFADPTQAARLLRAGAHHRHGNRGPLIPSSPGGQGMRRIAGSRIYEASAVHPFSVGFYQSPMLIDVHVDTDIDADIKAQVERKRAGRRFGRPAR